MCKCAQHKDDYAFWLKLTLFCIIPDTDTPPAHYADGDAYMMKAQYGTKTSFNEKGNAE